MGRIAPHLLKEGEREEANFFSEAAKLNQVVVDMTTQIIKDGSNYSLSYS